jgi:hypothetical protein
MWWFLPAASAAVPLSGSVTWSPLQDSPVRVSCTEVDAKPYCQSTGVIGAPVAEAAATFAKLDEHVDKMGAISRIDRLEADVLHIVMDYPFPLKDRDYVARFTRRTEADGSEVFSWVPVTHAKAPATSDAIRLTWLDGEWRFTPEGEHTRVTYVWEADPGGSLPDVGAVRKQAGTLAIKDIANACGTKLLSP